VEEQLIDSYPDDESEDSPNWKNGRGKAPWHFSYDGGAGTKPLEELSTQITFSYLDRYDADDDLPIRFIGVGSEDDDREEYDSLEFE
jgi:hypothetical protein